MGLYVSFRKVAVQCVPDRVRIWAKKRRNKDVIRDGRWLARQMRRGIKSDSRFKAYIAASNLAAWSVLPVDTWEREQKEREILKKYDFGFETMLIVRNPYGRTPLSALILFHTKEMCYAAYTVKGKTRDCDFDFVSEEMKRQHRIPLIGLYAEHGNRVEIRLLNERKETVARKQIVIPVGKIPEKFTDMVNPVQRAEDSAVPFMMVTGGINGSTYAYDQNGDIRYYLSRMPKQYGIYPMPDGRFLFPERNINRPTYINPHANVMYDMDLLGRVRETYYIPGGTHHWAIAVPGTQGRRILAGASSMEERMEDVVVCYDRNTGTVISKYDLGELFPEKFRNRCDWAHLNCIQCCGQKHILVSLRNIHTIAKIDLETFEIVWVLAHPQLYEGTELEKKVLQPQGEEFHHFFQQHAVEVVHTGLGEEQQQKETMEVMLFDNHCITKRKVPWHDGSEESYICFYKISERDMTVTTEKVFPCALSPTRSNAWFDRDRRRVFAMAGAAGAVTEGEKAVICEWDFDTKKEVGRVEIGQGFFRAFPFEISDKSLGSYLETKSDFRKGELEMPILRKNFSFPPKLSRFGMGTEVNVACMDDLILVRSQDHKLERVYFAGDSVWEKDFTDTYQKSEVFAQKVYYVAVPVNLLEKGKYRIIIQYDGRMYETGKWFECK